MITDHFLDTNIILFSILDGHPENENVKIYLCKTCYDRCISYNVDIECLTVIDEIEDIGIEFLQYIDDEIKKNRKNIFTDMPNLLTFSEEDQLILCKDWIPENYLTPYLEKYKTQMDEKIVRRLNSFVECNLDRIANMVLRNYTTESCMTNVENSLQIARTHMDDNTIGNANLTKYETPDNLDTYKEMYKNQMDQIGEFKNKSDLLLLMDSYHIKINEIENPYIAFLTNDSEDIITKKPTLENALTGVTIERYIDHIR